MRPRDHVRGSHPADLAGCSGTGIDCRLDCTNIAADDDRDKAAAGLLTRDDLHISGLDHCVGGLGRCNEPYRLDQSKSVSFNCHRCYSTFCLPRSSRISSRRLAGAANRRKPDRYKSTTSSAEWSAAQSIPTVCLPLEPAADSTLLNRLSKKPGR